jgi:hypothetical protein
LLDVVGCSRRLRRYERLYPCSKTLIALDRVPNATVPVTLSRRRENDRIIHDIYSIFETSKSLKAAAGFPVDDRIVELGIVCKSTLHHLDGSTRNGRCPLQSARASGRMPAARRPKSGAKAGTCEGRESKSRHICSALSAKSRASLRRGSVQRKLFNPK